MGPSSNTAKIMDKWSVVHAWYHPTLEEGLKPAIHSKCTELLTNGVVFHYDNT